MKKQIKLQELPKGINALVKQGYTITRVVKNGKNHLDDGPYVMVEYDNTQCCGKTEDKPKCPFTKSLLLTLLVGGIITATFAIINLFW